MRIMAGIWTLIVAVLLAGCGAVEEDKAPDYRYRLTVEVETPEGLKTGSSVIEVKQNLGRAGSDPSKSQIYRKLRGEAVAVDLSDGRTLFALLRSESDNEWAETVVEQVAPASGRGSDGPRFDAALNLRGVKPLPRTWPSNGVLPRRSAYPMLVTFGDLDDPTSVGLVDPDDLAATFGEGFGLRQITVEVVKDPSKPTIDQRLPWLAKTNGSIGLTPIEARRTGRNPNALSTQVTEGDFTQGMN